jgi:DTW domain-containing protein YfiP
MLRAFRTDFSTMPSLTDEQILSRCQRCYQYGDTCLCSLIPTVPTRTRFVILRHYIEERRSSNTGRIAALAMPNSELLAYGGGRPFDESPLCQPGTWLLYPGASGPPPPEAPRRVIVLDGTWRQSRRMVHKIAALRRLPCLSLSPPPGPVARLREPTVPDGMSTLEAIAAAVRALEGPQVSLPLEELFAQMVERGLRLRGRRSAYAGTVTGSGSCG